MGSEKGLGGRRGSKKRRLEGLEVKMTSVPASSSLLFSISFFWFLQKAPKLETFFFLSTKGIDLPFGRFGRAFQV